MSSKTDQILKALEGRTDWVDARSLAETLGVTTRSVRNYVKRINAGLETPMVESSYRGYRLSSEYAAARRRGGSKGVQRDVPPQEERADAILRRLILENGPVSVYDLADEFYVSDSTIEADLRRVRDSVRLFDLALARCRDTVALEGSELSKRKLIGQLLIKEGPGGFSALAGRGLAHEGYDSASLMRVVGEQLEADGLHSDDFGLGNVTVHLVIMVDRVRQGMQMPDDACENRAEGTPAHHAARELCLKMSELFEVSIPQSEVGYLALVIASNSRSDDYSFAAQTDLASLVDERDIDITQQAVAELEHAYYLEPFDSDFIMRMAVHVHSLLQRVEGGVGARNPLLGKIKETYPLIYDMAVFLARSLAQHMGKPLSEDEIAFLAFHIGASLEKNAASSDQLSATFLYMDYHDMYRLALDRIRDEFKSSLSVTSVEPVSGFNPASVECDLVISPIELEGCSARLIVVSPILKESDLRAIRSAIDELRASRRGEQTSTLINRFLTPELFHRGAEADKPEQMIRLLVDDCLARGYVGEGFCDEVLEREALSPTSFPYGVAIPHAMAASATRSFLSVVTLEQPMQWGPHEVGLVMLMGISAGDRKLFRLLFDSLLEVLSESANVRRLSRSTRYDEFAEQLNSMIGA